MDITNQTLRRVFQLTFSTVVRLGMFAAGVFLDSHIAAQTPAPPPPAPALPPGALYATITYISGQSVITVASDGLFDSVGLQAGDSVQVAVQYPENKAGETVRVEARDGGKLLSPSTAARVVNASVLPLVIGSDGILRFTFEAASNPGQNQISLRQGANALSLQFWVINGENPQDNPPVITPDNPSY
jgi:hypothetical protein